VAGRIDVSAASTLSPEAFLTLFFGPGNDVQFGAIEQRGSGHPLQPWVSRVRLQPWSATVLPRKNGKSVTYYAIAPGPQELRSLSELVMAFAGPSYSTFDGDLTPVESGDDFEDVVREFTGGSYFRFTSPEKAQLWSALERMRRVWDRRPFRPEIRHRGPARLLRDFDNSLATRNRPAADAVLRELAAGGHFDALNLAFLKVRLLGSLEAWHELLSIQELRDLLTVRRPRVVTSYLLQAVYEHEFRVFEAAGDARAAGERFREFVQAAYPTLWEIRTGFTAPSALKLLLLASVAGSNPDALARDHLLDACQSLGAQDAEWIRAVASLLTDQAPPPVLTVEEAERAWIEGDCDRAWQIACQLSPSIRGGSILVQSARVLDSLQTKRQALERLQAFPEEIRKGILARRPARLAWEHLETPVPPEATGPPPAPALLSPTSWNDWFDALAIASDKQHLVRVAREGEHQWNPNDILTTTDGVNRIVAAFGRNKTAEEESALMAALPVLFRALRRIDPGEQAGLRPIYLTLRERLICQGEEVSLQDAHLHNEILRTLLSLGVSTKEYGTFLEEIVGIWTSKLQSSMFAEWALDLLDILVDAPALERQARECVFVQVQDSIQRNGRRLGIGIMELFNALCREAGVEHCAVPVKPDTVQHKGGLDWLAGKTVLLYSLQSEVLARVKRMLLAEVGDLTVHTSDDHAGTDRLRNSTRQSDLVVLATGAAKHAATDFIERNKRADAVRIFAQGKGTMGMWRTILEAGTTIVAA
jgi:hypothetical protein